VLRGAAATSVVAFGLLWAAAILPHGARTGVLVAAITIFTLAEILHRSVPVQSALLQVVAVPGFELGKAEAIRFAVRRTTSQAGHR
jgi:hypothetical protein